MCAEAEWKLVSSYQLCFALLTSEVYQSRYLEDSPLWFPRLKQFDWGRKVLRLNLLKHNKSLVSALGKTQQFLILTCYKKTNHLNLFSKQQLKCTFKYLFKTNWWDSLATYHKTLQISKAKAYSLPFKVTRSAYAVQCKLQNI